MPPQKNKIIIDLPMYEINTRTLSFLTGSTVYEGDFAIITVPLGVLKTANITFSPTLSQEKQEAIEAVGMSTGEIQKKSKQ